jgi:nitrate reductase cytochrome c-type subunit
MQKNNQKSKVFLKIVSIALVAVLLIGAGISGAEKDKQKSELTEEKEKPEKKVNKKEKDVKAPKNFVPTEKVTADQAVAFPSDI